MNKAELNEKLNDYDTSFFVRLEPVLEQIAQKSNALASNLKDCVVQLQNSDRYLNAASGKEVFIKEKDLEGLEFDIFRKYVRLLRSCTIMCGNDLSLEFKKLFLDFFAGERLEQAKALS